MAMCKKHAMSVVLLEDVIHWADSRALSLGAGSDYLAAPQAQALHGAQVSQMDTSMCPEASFVTSFLYSLSDHAVAVSPLFNVTCSDGSLLMANGLDADAIASTIQVSSALGNPIQYLVRQFGVSTTYATAGATTAND